MTGMNFKTYTPKILKNLLKKLEMVKEVCTLTSAQKPHQRISYRTTKMYLIHKHFQN